jgi:hypothetical protein
MKVVFFRELRKTSFFWILLFGSLVLGQQPVEEEQEVNANEPAPNCVRSCFTTTCFRSFGMLSDRGLQYDTDIAYICRHLGERKAGEPADLKTVKTRPASYQQECDGFLGVDKAYPGTGKCTSNGNWSDTTKNRLCEPKKSSVVEEESVQ